MRRMRALLTVAACGTPTKTEPAVWEPLPGEGATDVRLAADGNDVWFIAQRGESSELFLTKTAANGNPLVAQTRVDTSVGAVCSAMPL